MPKLVKVTFTEDFKPYGIKKGTVREVSEAVAHKLLDVYGVIDDPFNAMPSLVMIRMLAKITKYGSGWYPYSEHLVSGEIAKELIDGGLAHLAAESVAPVMETVADDHFDTHSSFCSRHPKIEGIAEWLNALKYENDNTRINAISLAVQCSRSQAEKIYEKIQV